MDICKTTPHITLFYLVHAKGTAKKKKENDLADSTHHAAHKDYWPKYVHVV